MIVNLPPEDPLFSMADKQGYVFIHRLVMARHLGRPLLKNEFIHHKNGIKVDNRLENLELISHQNHAIKTMLCSSCELRKEIRLLKWQIKELQNQVRETNLKRLGL